MARITRSQTAATPNIPTGERDVKCDFQQYINTFNESYTVTFNGGTKCDKYNVVKSGEMLSWFCQYLSEKPAQDWKKTFTEMNDPSTTINTWFGGFAKMYFDRGGVRKTLQQVMHKEVVADYEGGDTDKNRSAINKSKSSSITSFQKSCIKKMRAMVNENLAVFLSLCVSLFRHKHKEYSEQSMNNTLGYDLIRDYNSLVNRKQHYEFYNFDESQYDPSVVETCSAQFSYDENPLPVNSNASHEKKRKQIAKLVSKDRYLASKRAKVQSKLKIQTEEQKEFALKKLSFIADQTSRNFMREAIGFGMEQDALYKEVSKTVAKYLIEYVPDSTFQDDMSAYKKKLENLQSNYNFEPDINYIDGTDEEALKIEAEKGIPPEVDGYEDPEKAQENTIGTVLSISIDDLPGTSSSLAPCQATASKGSKKSFDDNNKDLDESNSNDTENFSQYTRDRNQKSCEVEEEGIQEVLQSPSPTAMTEENTAHDNVADLIQQDNIQIDNTMNEEANEEDGDDEENEKEGVDEEHEEEGDQDNSVPEDVVGEPLAQSVNKTQSISSTSSAVYGKSNDRVCSSGSEDDETSPAPAPSTTFVNNAQPFEAVVISHDPPGNSGSTTNAEVSRSFPNDNIPQTEDDISLPLPPFTTSQKKLYLDRTSKLKREKEALIKLRMNPNTLPDSIIVKEKFIRTIERSINDVIDEARTNG